jgi:ubiquinone/menaquinone biosynthesis C-methylase UbiE
VSATESKYIEKKAYLSRYTHERILALREAAKPGPDERCLVQADGSLHPELGLSKFIPFLAKKCGLEFRGRILEIGAGEAWLSAELSKLPRVVAIITTDFSPKLLKEAAPKMFRLLGANGAKITRIPGDFHKLDFPNNHFDFVVCSAVLYHATNMVQVLREAKRVLKPGGKFVAVREPIWPLMRLDSRARKSAPDGGGQKVKYTLTYYKELFKQAAMPVEVIRVNFSRGVKFYVDEMVNGLTHARYAFIGTKLSSGGKR